MTAANKIQVFRICALTFAISVTFPGCFGGVTLKHVSPETSFRRMQSNAVATDTLSAHTAQELRRFNLTNDYATDPDKAMRELRNRACSDPDRYLLFSMSEMSYATARGIEKKRPKDAIGYYFSSLRFAYAFLFDDNLGPRPNEYDPRFRLACEIYNQSLARAIRLFRKSTPPSQDEVVRVDTWDGPVNLSVQLHGFPADAQQFSELLLASDYEVKGLHNQYRTYGLGVPLIAVAEHTDSDANKPPRASYPATALIQFNRLACVDYDKPLDATLDLYDPIHVAEIEIDGAHAPVESDTTTPLGYLLSDPALVSDAYIGLLRADRTADRTGLYMIEPYDPKKIPVVLVHGLVSSPLAWAQMLNDLRGDPTIRDRFQFWFFQYPTGYPFAYSASLLRQALLDARAKYDPEGDDATFNDMVLVGHSMGGLLSKLMVQQSGDSLWNSMSAKPIDDVHASDEQKDMLRRVLFYEPLPFVKRVVFMATPHRGSGLSDRKFATAIAGLIALPKFLVTTTFDVLTLDVGETGEGLKARDLTSVKNLSPHNKLILATQHLPITVPYHSVIGNIRKGDDADGSDGVVPYWSSHLDGAQSELVVPTYHSVQYHPLAILEVRRILLLHLADFDQGKSVNMPILAAPN